MTRKVRVRDYMSKDVISVRPDTDIMEVVRLLVTHNLNAVPVIDKRGGLVGMISERDCLKMALQAAYYGEKGGKVREFMASEVATVHAEDNLLDLAKLFIENPYKRYPVLHDHEIVGVISRQDLMRALLALWG